MSEQQAPRMLADLLWERANELLWNGSCAYGFGERGWRFTCDAVGTRLDYKAKQAAFSLLHSCGLPTNASDRYDLFGDFDYGEERQGVRYMWLLLAMHVAEDEGLTV
jgi:hypothetical protein